MRFTKDVKQCWSKGLHLFRAKFIRLMGGYKARGVLYGDPILTMGKLAPDKCQINFVCHNLNEPRRQKKTFKIDCERPVLIYFNLSVVAEKLRNRAYKICIDVKKNSAGFGQKLGEVDLYGHEPNATLE